MGNVSYNSFSSSIDKEKYSFFFFITILIMTSSEEINRVDIDMMLHHVGDFGRYQCLLIFLFSVINVLSAFHYFGQTFISIIPEHKCKLLDNEIGVKIPLQCAKEENNNIKVSCTSGWNYNRSYGYVSIVEELNWVCNDDWKPALGQSIFFIGSVIGSLVYGILADRIGRLNTLVLANMTAFFGNIATVLSRDVVTFAISRFIAGCATDANFVMMYIIVMEYIRPSMRTLGLNLCIGVFYCISCMLVPWAAVLLKTWRNLLLIIGIPHLLALSFRYLVPESANWLISKNKIDDALKCFERIAKINKKCINPKAVDGLKLYCSEHITKNDVNKNKHENFIGLLKTPKLRRKTLILIFKSMVMTLCYDAISRNVNGLGYSPFVIFSATSATILPACVFISLVQDRIGRKALASGSLLLSGIFTACSGLILATVDIPNPTLIVSFAIIARLGINVAYNSGAQYAVELIPTEVRGQGVSVIHVTGYAATFFSSQILYLSNIWTPAPEVILGILLVLGSLACLFLPETLNRTLPITLQDAEEFGEGEGIFEFSCCRTVTDSTLALNPNLKTKYSNEKY